jgi:hypothetical protein
LPRAPRHDYSFLETAEILDTIQTFASLCSAYPSADLAIRVLTEVELVEKGISALGAK